ncbi:ABC transporter permease [Candidatus Bipolaricaulota bacterium]|nr:ABC transporter permease [Candidatus Bipolaricaulota bacterium]
MRHETGQSTLIRILRKPKGVIGVLFLVVLILMGILAPYIATSNPLQQNLRLRNSPPGSETPAGARLLLGADQLGRDLLSRILHGIRFSLLIAAAAIFVSGVVGCALGVLSGYVGGVLDSLVMRVVDIQLSLPLILIAMVWLAFTRPSAINVIAIIALWTWTQYARTARAATLAVRGSGFIEAARAVGVSVPAILMRHVMPNISASILVIASVQFGRAIILEATLSFLGVGLQPPAITLGAMIASGRQYVDTAWWIATFPGVAIMLMVLGANFLGDTLRDVWDPKLR